MAIFGIDIEYDGNGLSEPDIAGETLVAGDLCYLNNDSKYYKASASSKLTSTTEVRMALSYIPINTSGMFLIRGKFTMAGLTAGDKYYISEALGQFTNVQPNGTATNVIRYVGTAYSSTVLEFNVDETYVLADGSELNEVTLPAGGGGSGHVIQDEGVSMNARTNLNFIGSAVSVSDSPGTSSTNVTIVDSGAHVHTNLPLLETYDQTNADIANAVVNAHTVYSLGTKTVTETGLTNGDVLSFNSTSGMLEYVAQTGGVTDHTALTSIGTNTHSQIDTHIADGTIHYTQSAISIAESQVVDLVGKYELALGNPAADGYVLTSTAGGVRTWENISSGGPEADTLDSVTTRGSTTNNSLSTGTLDVTGNVESTGWFKSLLYTSDADVVIDSPTVSNILGRTHIRNYIDSDNNGTGSTFDVLSNTNSYISGNVVFSINETGTITTKNHGTSTQWESAYLHSLLTTGNPHQVTGAQVALTGYVKPGTTSAVLATDSTNTAIGKLEKAIDDVINSGGMTSFNIMEGNGTETTSVTNAETIHFEQGTGMQVELTSTSGGGQLTFTNTSPNTNLIHTGEVTGATALTIASNVVDLDNLSVSGTPTTAKYLRYDAAGTGLIWATPTFTDTDTWRPVVAAGNTLGAAETLTMNAGTAMSLTESAGTVTFNAAPSWDLEVQGVFKEAITQGENVSFDGGTGITVTGTTVTNPNVTHSITDNGVGATQLNVVGNGTTAQYLRADGDGSFTWATPPDNNTIYSGWDLYEGGVFKNSITSNENVNFVGGTNIDIKWTNTLDNTMTISYDFSGTEPWVRKDIADTQTGGITFLTGEIRANNNVPVAFGSGNAIGSQITSDGFDTKWKILTSNIQIVDSSNIPKITFTDTGSLNMAGYLNVAMDTVMTGTLNVGGFIYGAKGYETSDIKLKENLVPIEVEKEPFNYYKFDWKATGETGYGVIAQEVQESYPELVSESEGTLHVDYTGVLINEIMALRARLEALEASQK